MNEKVLQARKHQQQQKQVIFLFHLFKRFDLSKLFFFGFLFLSITLAGETHKN